MQLKGPGYLETQGEEGKDGIEEGRKEGRSLRNRHRRPALPSSERKNKSPHKMAKITKEDDKEPLGDSNREKERRRAGKKGITGRKPQRTGAWGRLAWSGRSQGPKKGYLYVIVLEPTQCQ